MAAESPAWNRIVTFILQSKRPSHGNKEIGRDWSINGECCVTEASGKWCRRHKFTDDAGHYRGDNRTVDQLGQLYEATDWSRSCSAASFSTRKHQLNLPAVFSILVNFGLNQYYHFLVSLLNYLEESSAHDCEQGFVWDPFAFDCRQIYCSSDNVNSLFKDHCPESHNNETSADWRMLYVMEMDVIQLTLYADAIFDNQTAMSDDELIELIEENFTAAFASFVKIDPHRISELSVVIINSSSPSVRSLAIDFRLCQAPEGSDEPTIDSVVALIGSLVVQDDLVVIVQGVPVQLVGLHEQPTDSETDRFAEWCRYFKFP